ncbi:MAG: helix-turn-helix transcriptional regulator, partial [Actinomycetota bacterium]
MNQRIEEPPMRVNAKLIRELRDERAWSQEELARATGLNTRTIQRIERDGTASLQSQRALADALGLAPKDLAATEGDPASPCPTCGSDEVYRYTHRVDTTTIGGELLPGLSGRRLSSAK